MIPLCVPNIKGNEQHYVKECIETEWVVDGKYITLFEGKVKGYVGSKFAVACANGTSALHISLIISGVKNDDEVIVPTITFIAPVNVVKYIGAHPIFMDCDDYYNMDVNKLKQFIEEECEFSNDKLINKTTKKQIKAIIPVHVFGNPVDMDPLMDLAQKYNLTVIEDATESLGSRYKGKFTGTIGNIGCFSFNGNKIITTGGGGMIVTDNQEVAEKARYLINQAKDDGVRYVHHEIGFNYRLSNVHAAIGVGQMERLSEYIEIKRQNFQKYRELLKDADIKLTEEPEYAESNYWFYAIKLGSSFDKESLIKLFSDNKIQVRPLWAPIHIQKPYQDCQAYKIEKALELWNKTINIPCSINITDEEIKEVSEVFKNG
ncbi:LegC family aminotransferase [Candidatus Woesearchaeota archaeon]|nr:LegC family aminotransferase [Candidatus Woesearchaeota archaeon]MBW3022160.1 LegC family aminotransferase [Candidatus Woesearchaeota archaeon]